MLGFSLVREREHIAMIRENADGTKTPLTLQETGQKAPVISAGECQEGSAVEHVDVALICLH